ncbi:Solute carrier family 2, facilitated glucose transporter member 8 [Oopsacas minuta]|uniref:Solute carrier family 2, facilitated glucose transporter member 8 n=1 Tax=Oopsacas minuta TaxID=111878 RepID=A0AAV7JLG9_9METZ|nr:Solute carrier family 2, facilitated glucose transporter member 8 [Oopsacas minuta]
MNLSNLPTYIAVFSSYIGAISTIFIVGFPSPTQKQLIDENILDYQTLPIFASISYITCILGLSSAPLLVQLGFNLKLQVVISSVLGIAGYVLIVIANSAAYVIIGVALVGYYSGIAVIFVFAYIAEVTLDNQRKVMSGGIGFCIRLGLFIAYFAGIWLPFRWLAVFGLIQACLFCLLILFNPLSPVWYVQQGLDDKAKSTLLYLHGSEFDADTEIQKIKGKTLSSKISWIESFRTLKEWKVLKPMILMAVIASLKELGGHGAMVAFSSHILENQQAMDPKVASLFYPIFLIIGAIMCILIMNYCRLKWLMITASIFQAISYISMAIYYLVSEHYLHCNTEYSQLYHTLAFWPIFNIALFSFSFGIGWGLVYFALVGIMFTMHSELFTAITDMIAHISAYIVVMIFFYLLHNIGGFATFLIFSCNYLIAIVLVYFFFNI